MDDRGATDDALAVFSPFGGGLRRKKDAIRAQWRQVPAPASPTYFSRAIEPAESSCSSDRADDGGSQASEISSEERPFSPIPRHPSSPSSSPSPPAVLSPHEQQLLRRLLDAPGIQIAGLDFGLLQRDVKTFSSEYSTPLGNGNIERRGADALSIRGDGFSPPRTILLRLSFDSVASILIDDNGNVLLEILYAPTFQEVPERKSGPSRGDPIFRTLAFDDALQAVAPFFHHLLIRFYSENDVKRFLSAISTLPLPRPIPNAAFTINSDLHLFAAEKLRRLRSLLSNLDITNAFQVEAILYDGTLLPEEIEELVQAVDALRVKYGAATTERILLELRTRLKEDLRTRKYFSSSTKAPERPLPQFSAYDHLERARRRIVRDLQRLLLPNDGTHFLCRHAMISPMGIRMEGPYIEEGSSITRRYPEGVDSLLRVSFVEEDGSVIRVGRTGVGQGFLERFILPPLLEGLDLGGRSYAFLGYSQAAMKNRSVLMVAKFDSDKVATGKQVDAETIRTSAGDFDAIRHRPSLYGARLSQGFTSSRSTIILHESEILEMDDILAGHDGPGPNLSDGCGTISPQLRDRIWEVLLQNGYRRDRDLPPPSAFQIRLGGWKGMVVLDTTLGPGTILVARKSMKKYGSTPDTPEGWTLNIAKAFTRPGLLALNRPLVSALDDLEIPHSHFLDLLEKARDELAESKVSYEIAAQLLNRYECGNSSRLDSLFANLSRDVDLSPDSPLLASEPFLKTAMDLIASRVLRDFKSSARIPLPASYQLVGVPDFDSFLAPSEIYACIRTPNKPLHFLEGTFAISRSPTVGPADVRIVRAVGKVSSPRAKRLPHIFNCVVFPTRGDRSLASMMGGGDYDGDEFQIIAEKELVPEREVPPGAHVALEHKSLDHPAEIKDVAEALVRYIVGDTVGTIAITHLREADSNREHGHSEICLKLAELSSSPRKAVPRDPDLDMSPPAEVNDTQTARTALPTPRPDSSSRAFFHLRQTLGDRIQKLLRLSTSPYLELLPDDLVDLAARLFETFTSQALHLAAFTNFPRKVDAVLSETELFAGTILHAGSENASLKKPRRAAIQNLQLQVSQLVDAIEEAASSGRTLGEKVLCLLSFWGEALEASTEDYGVRAARWIAVALLVETIKEVEAKGPDWRPEKMERREEGGEEVVDQSEDNLGALVDLKGPLEASWGSDALAGSEDSGW